MLKEVFNLAWTTFQQSLAGVGNHVITLAWIFFTMLVIWAMKETHYLISVVVALIKEEIRWSRRNKSL